jgi:phosphinothricin acetyltransferase
MRKETRMQRETITIGPAKQADLDAILTLLRKSGLPTDGLADHISTTLVARESDRILGSAALEVYGTDVLLRSVAVDEGMRGQGLGIRLTQAALDYATVRGIRNVYLLTETAGEFFPRFGFTPTTREAVPPSVRQSVEFTTACPDTALVMSRPLRPHRVDLQARAATPRDAEAIARIYNQGIEERVATFETRLRTPQDVEAWFDGIHPVVVVEQDGEVVAFASTSTYRPRACYAGVAEFSVYTAREARGMGAGRLAMLALLQAAEQAGFWKLLSRIFPENSASLALMRSLGFREVGIYEKHGKLDGTWRDVVIVEKMIEGNIT